MTPSKHSLMRKLKASLSQRKVVLDPSFDLGVQLFLQKVLRHETPKTQLNVNGQGWAEIEHVLYLTNAKFQAIHDWAEFDEPRLSQLVQANCDRLEISGDRIRARYGHSRPVIAGRLADPPPFLLHATPTRLVDSILANGLLPLGRNLVHLTSNHDYLRMVGSGDGQPMRGLRIATTICIAEGCRFFRATDHVWQTHAVPPSAIVATSNAMS